MEAGGEVAFTIPIKKEEMERRLMVGGSWRGGG